MYKLIKSAYTNEVSGASKTETNGHTIVFVFDPANTDYQAYLRWLEAGNVPTPAEENQ
jgi:hypothetical protein